MRNNRKSSDSAADRQGPLTALMRAAEPLEQLGTAARERIRHRLRGELAGRSLVARRRLLTVMAGVGLLLAGGVAVAGRWGLIRWPAALRAPVAENQEAGEKPRRPMRARPRSGGPAGPEPSSQVSEQAVPLPPASATEEAMIVVEPKGTSFAAPTRARRASPATEAAKSRVAPRETPVSAPTPALLPPPPPPPTSAPSLAVVSAPRAATPSPALALVTPPDPPSRIAKATPATAARAPDAQDMLGQAMRSLRRQHDPAAALDVLARHAALFPQSPLAGERTQLEVEALLALGRNPEALLRLDRLALDKTPHAAERHVVRGELRAQVRRWGEAAADFDQALATAKASSPWHERALWGRAMARVNAGDRLGSRADMRLYLQSYPHGRFASEAARRLADQP